ncbi:1-acyl-sn-glycerol-3-phosphate acyltransferase [Flavobacterium gilvum]|uniref:Phospholipid/glycerol acyltransferase domain-containing protein n=1 Tax=Flavobacterium gilvum TaxID=1492737 RepID=A0AAC9N6G6_9FLAO|nr:1-acyl-sn-glycerol-3-phosphate acyltransferase [Flavobacterium gilvum]AOW10362.1 hypothetical protein EM308_13090 [Flavobacterium gilvum]KFC60700.1 1-acylglycerol-3-phosphate O-acyltransferase [Flavobacterium gilvum]
MQNRIKTKLRITIASVLLIISGSMGIILRIISVDYLLNFNRKYLVSFSSKLVLKIIGIKIQLPNEIPFNSENQYFITFNHNSDLDIFALTALGYTNTVFLLSDRTLKIVPLTLSAISIGVLYIPEQHKTEKRLDFFKKLEKIAKTKKINIAGSSEGVHDQLHGIGNFNKGVYHLTTVCKLDIIPVFIGIPEEINLIKGHEHLKSGNIKVEILETIDTQNWILNDLEKNKDEVRNIYVKKFNEVHKTAIV